MKEIIDLLTNKLDKMDEKLDNLSLDMVEQKQSFKQHLEQDSELFLEIKPIVESFKFEQELKKRRATQISQAAKVLGIVVTIVTLAPVVYSIIK